MVRRAVKVNSKSTVVLYSERYQPDGSVDDCTMHGQQKLGKRDGQSVAGPLLFLPGFLGHTHNWEDGFAACKQ